MHYSEGYCLILRNDSIIFINAFGLQQGKTCWSNVEIIAIFG